MFTTVNTDLDADGHSLRRCRGFVDLPAGDGNLGTGPHSSYECERQSQRDLGPFKRSGRIYFSDGWRDAVIPSKTIQGYYERQRQ